MFNSIQYNIFMFVVLNTLVAKTYDPSNAVAAKKYEKTYDKTRKN